MDTSGQGGRLRVVGEGGGRGGGLAKTLIECAAKKLMTVYVLKIFAFFRCMTLI
jgi:hypothetical protein